MRRLNSTQKAELLGDAHVYGGALTLSVGAGLVYAPLGLMIFGAFVCGLGLLWRGK